MTGDIVRADAGGVVARLGRLLDPLAGSRLLVTGASSFPGRLFLAALSAFNATHPRHPARVTALADLASIDAAGDIVPDWIIHLAGLAPPAAGPVALEGLQGTWDALELARRGAHGMLALSAGAQEMETLCATSFRLHHAPVTVVRPFGLYGPGQSLAEGGIVNHLIRQALAGRPLVARTVGPLSLCYASDFVEACLTLLLMPDANGEAFDVGNSEPTDIETIAGIIATTADPPLTVRIHPGIADDTRLPDLGRLERLTGFTARVPLATGLARTFAAHHRKIF